MKDHWENGFVPTRPARANLTSYWMDMDSEDNFKRNPKPGYTETSIVYNYNSCGYRTAEFNYTDPGILCFGCSFTEGIGLREEDIWVNHLNLPYSVYNLATSGSSGDTVAKTLTNVASLFNIHAVFILWPNKFRYDVYKQDGFETNTPQDKTGYGPTVLTDVNFYNIRQRNKLIVSLLGEKYKFTVIEQTIEELDDGRMDYARDMHFGPKWHQKVANKFKEKYTSGKI